MTTSGELCATTTGASPTPTWCASSWAAGQRSRPTAQLTLAGDRAEFGWTTFSATGPKLPCPNAWPDLGVPTTATMEKTPVSCAQVTSYLWTRKRRSVGDALLRGFVPVSQLQSRAGQQTPGWVTLSPLSHLNNMPRWHSSTQVHESKEQRG